MNASFLLLAAWAAVFYIPCAIAAVSEWKRDMRVPTHPHSEASR